ncbi:MAG: hypothetical protein HC926_05135 [Synechococcaceae cyanobacterium SM2_3_60]|nr:hypothetical protein [Synechococcaceae cyanobacterium SM2_3_60]
MSMFSFARRSLALGVAAGLATVFSGSFHSLKKIAPAHPKWPSSFVIAMAI